MTRLFGITVAGGLSSENRVFARLLSERGDRYDALVVVHDESGTEAVIADHFAGLAKTRTVPIDTGWRPNRWTHRGNPGAGAGGAALPTPPRSHHRRRRRVRARRRLLLPAALRLPGRVEGRQLAHGAADRPPPLHGRSLASACRAQQAADHRPGRRRQRLRPRAGDQARRAGAPGDDHPQHDAALRPARRGEKPGAPRRARSARGPVRVRARRPVRPWKGSSRRHRRVRARRPSSATTCRWCSWVRAGSNTRSMPAPAVLRPPIASSSPANDPTCPSCSRCSTRWCTRPPRIRARWRCSRPWRLRCRSSPTPTAACPSSSHPAKRGARRSR